MEKKDKIKVSRVYLAKLQLIEKFVEDLHDAGVAEWSGYHSVLSRQDMRMRS